MYVIATPPSFASPVLLSITPAFASLLSTSKLLSSELSGSIGDGGLGRSRQRDRRVRELLERKDGRYSIFPKSPVATQVVVKGGWFEVQQTDLRPLARLKVFTDIASNSINPLPSF